jgi:hypothetical protein
MLYPLGELINSNMESSAVQIHSLSALFPVNFTYKYNKEEKLSGQLATYNNGFGYYKHDLFDNFQDASLSKKNLLVITDVKQLKTIFDKDSESVSVGNISGCAFLKAVNGKYLCNLNNDVYVGGIGEKLFVNIVPITKNIVELKTTKTQRLQIDKEYPYTARLSEEVLDGEELERQRFEIDFKDGLMSFKTKTQEGYRFLSYGMDQVLRAVGLMLNNTTVNPYFFIPDFVSESSILYNFDAKTTEIKYFNELANTDNRTTVNIKEEQETNTNLLVSCSTKDISKLNTVSVNIALIKTNFSSSGSYTAK